MRISIVRTDKKNADHLSVKTIEWFLERIQTDTKAGDIGKLRAYIANFVPRSCDGDSLRTSM